MFPEHVMHSEVKVENAHIYSAGFFEDNGVIKVDQHRISESLQVGPKMEDEKILSRALNGFPAEEFTDKRIN